MRQISFPTTRNFTAYRNLSSALVIFGGGEKNRLHTASTGFWDREIEEPPKGSLNSELKLCLHNVKITS